MSEQPQASTPVIVNVGTNFNRRTIIGTILSVLVIGSLICLAWYYLGPQRPKLDPARQAWVNKAVTQIAQDISVHKNDVRTVTVYSINGDPSGMIFQQLHQALIKTGSFDVLDKSFTQKTGDKLSLSLGELDESTANTAAGKFAANRNADAAIWGVCRKLEKEDGNVIGDIQYSLVDKTGKPLYQGECNNSNIQKDIIPTLQVSDSWFNQLIIWVLIVLILPILTITFLKSMTAKRSNKTNAFVLFLYTFIDALAACLLMSVNFENTTSILIFLALIVAAGIYNLQIMAFALKLQEE